jgi:hypothetical protein
VTFLGISSFNPRLDSGWAVISVAVFSTAPSESLTVRLSLGGIHQARRLCQLFLIGLVVWLVRAMGNVYYSTSGALTKVIKEKPMENISSLIPFLIPIVLLQLGLMVFALVDLMRRERTKGPKWVWALVIIFVNLIGPIVYLVAGREE